MPLSRATAISLLVAGAFFMENLDSTVIVTAIPQMAKSFGVQPVDLSIGVSAYILALAVLIPASGWLADRFGAKTVFAAAIVVFTLASVLCGVSPNLPVFVLARVVQGIGGAMMVPVGRLVVLRSARINGDVHYDALTIEQGAEVEGRFAHRAPAKAAAASRSDDGAPTLTLAG